MVHYALRFHKNVANIARENHVDRGTQSSREIGLKVGNSRVRFRNTILTLGLELGSPLRRLDTPPETSPNFLPPCRVMKHLLMNKRTGTSPLQNLFA